MSFPKKMLRRLSEVLHPHFGIPRREYRRWRVDKGEARRTDFSTLGPESVVFDIGGFTGSWADAIYDRYGCTVHIFEPHPRFAEALAKKFRGNAKIHVHPFALGSMDGLLPLSDEGDASSALSGASTMLNGEVVDVSRFMDEFTPASIDLAKINIEGGEYDLLPALARTGQLGRFDLLQIQFHLYDKQQIAERDAIRTDLSKTHTCDWSYDFVWEQWHRK